MQDIPVSIFSYDKELTIEKTTKKKDSFKEPEKPPFAGTVERLLLKYGILNLDMLCHAFYRYGQNKRIDLKKVVECLQKMGRIDKYTIRHPSRTRADVDIYTLRDDIWQEYIQKRKEKPLFKRNFSDIAYLMESLAVAQWHISVLSNNVRFKKEFTELMFNHPQITQEGMVQIPSLIRLKYFSKKGMYLCGIPVNRNYDLASLKKFICRVAKIDRFFLENADKYYSYIIIILCESVSQIEEVSKLFEVMEETKYLRLLYTIDMVTAKINPLMHLYEVERASGRAELTLVEL